MGETIHLQLPEAPALPDLSPQVGDLRERVAALEAHLEHTADPASVESSLSLASEAHRLASEAHAKLTAMESAAAHGLEAVENLPEQVVAELEEVAAPAAIANPEVPIAQPASESHTEHLPWWNPARYL
jgi:hypothetical protein